MPIFQTKQFKESQKAKGVSDEKINEFLKKKGIDPALESEEIAGPGEISFLQRLKLGFGGETSRQKAARLERQAGLSGKFDVGDIADVIAGIPSLAGFVGGGLVGGTIGAVGGPPGVVAGAALGAGAGAGAGESLRQLIGKGLETAGERPELGRVGEEIAFGTAAGLVGPVIGKVGKPVLQKFVVSPVKSIAKNVSTFFFGPEGTTGFAVRFQSPELGGFLATARRKVGAKLEDVVTMLDKSVTAVRDTANATFTKAEEALIEKRIPAEKSINQSKKIIQDFLKVDRLSIKEIGATGLSDTEIRAIQKMFQDIVGLKDFTTKGILTLRRKIDTLFKGTKATKVSDAIVTRLRNHFNKLIEEVDPAFREASKKWAADREFLEKIGVNIVGKTKLNVEQTSTRLLQLAKDLDNPFKREASEKLLKELGERTGVDFLKILTDLKTALNLSPQQSMGIRAGVVRELARILQVMISEGIAIGGRIRIGTSRFQMPDIIKRGVDPAERILYLQMLKELFK